MNPLRKYNKQHNRFKAYVCTLIFSSFMGTYLDLWFTGRELYSFPARPFPTLFSINILFTLIVLPALTSFIIFTFNRINRFQKIIMTLLLSILTAPIEHTFERWGLFVHSNDWNHFYSVIGYLIFIILVWHFYKWIKDD